MTSSGARRVHTVAGSTHWRRLLVILAVVALVAAACGDDDSSDEDTSETTESEESAETTTADTEATTESSAEGGEEGEAESMDMGEFQPIEGVPGVTDETITFALLSTGEANPLGYCLMECYTNGVNAYFEYVNSLGGVNGRELVLDPIVDDELVNGQVRALEIAENDGVFGVFYNGLQFPGMDTFGESGMPTYTNFVPAAESTGKENVFQMTGTQCVGCPVQLPIQSTIFGEGTTVGLLALSAAQSSVDSANGNEVAFETWGPDAGGLTVGYKNVDLPFGLPNGVAPEVTAMKDAGVDFVIGSIDQNSSVTFAQEMERQGMGDVNQVLPQGYLNEEFIQASPELFEGDILSVPFRPFEADLIPAQELFLEWMDETGADVTEHAMQGWLNAMLAVEGLKAAGPQFDRQGVIDATNAIEDWTYNGMTPPIDWGRQHVQPTFEDPVTNGNEPYCFSWVRVVGGEFELIGESDAPWWCWDQQGGEGWQWEEPVSMNFE